MTGWNASINVTPATMNAARMIRAPTMPNISTRCWYRAGTANAAKITAAAIAAAPGGHGYGVTPDRLRPTTPDRISPIDTSFVADTTSPRNTMPTVAAPAAPIPVHTA